MGYLIVGCIFFLILGIKITKLEVDMEILKEVMQHLLESNAGLLKNTILLNSSMKEITKEIHNKKEKENKNG